MFNLATGLVRRGMRVQFVVPDLSRIGSVPFKVPVEVVSLQARGERLSCVVPLARYLRREKPQVLLTTLPPGNLVSLWAKWLSGTRTRVVIREANTPSLSLRRRQGARRLLVRYLALAFYRLADAVVAGSQGSADDLTATLRVPADKVRIVHNPTVTDDLFAKAQEPCTHAWFRSGEPPVVIAVGRLIPQKGFSTLIQAFSEVRQGRVARLIILGEGKERPALDALVRRLGLENDVSLPGFVENPYCYLSRASVFVLSSFWEGLPNVLIEALACGVSPVATDCRSGPREILDGGRYGRLVPVGDSQALARAIEESFAQPVEKARLQERAASFSVDRAVPKYLEVLLPGQMHAEHRSEHGVPRPAATADRASAH